MRARKVRIFPSVHVKRRVARSKAAQRANGQATRERILQFIRTRHAEGNLVLPSYREIMDACGVSSTSVVNYHLRRLARDGAIIRTPGVARSAYIPAEVDTFYRVDQVVEEADFDKVRDPLLAYWQKMGEEGLYIHWVRRCVAWDEIPNLIAAVIKHAVAHAR